MLRWNASPDDKSWTATHEGEVDESKFEGREDPHVLHSTLDTN